MPLNPFVELARDPVTFLAALGYALGLLTLLIITVGYCLRTVPVLIARWQKNRHKDRWWGGYVPPADWALRLASVAFVLMLDAWAIGALVWLLGA